MAQGERVVSLSAGGGGFGSPLERDPKKVERDVQEGWITAARALEVYGVVLDSNGFADMAATESRRGAAARD